MLHWRNYTDSRLLVDLFTQKHGRIAGAFRQPSRKSKNTGTKPLQFSPSHACFHGRGELRTLTQLEQNGTPLLTEGVKLVCGMYLNELLMRLLPIGSAQASIFGHLAHAYQQLADCDAGAEDIYLRQFELHMLNELGYGIDFHHDIFGGLIEPSKAHFYRFNTTSGFEQLPCNEGATFKTHREEEIYSGYCLSQIANQNWTDPLCRQCAKKICRRAIAELLGGKPLRSRELF